MITSDDIDDAIPSPIELSDEGVAEFRRLMKEDADADLAGALLWDETIISSALSPQAKTDCGRMAGEITEELHLLEMAPEDLK